MIIQKNILVVNEKVISAPKNLKIRYNVEEGGFYGLLAIYEHIDSAKISLRKNNRLEGIFSLNTSFNSNGTAHNHNTDFDLYQDSNGSNDMVKILVNRERRQELGTFSLKKGLLTGVLLLDFTPGGIGTPDGRFQLILQKLREEDKAQ